MTPANTTKTNSILTIKLIVLFVVFFAFTNNTFGQNVDASTTVSISSENVNSSSSTNISENNNMNLYSWFMGTKQTPNANLEKDNAGSVKKQMINSGIEPNRLLLKSFLKKATNYTEVIA